MFLICNMSTVRLDPQIVSRKVVAEGLKKARCLGSFDQGVIGFVCKVADQNSESIMRLHYFVC